MVQDNAESDDAEPIDTPAAFLHMRGLAKRCLADPGTFRKRAVFDLAPADRTPEWLALVESGFRQIVEWQGFSPDKPFRGLGVGGLYAMLQALRFHVVRQTARPVEPSLFLDTLDARHEVLGLDVTLYNLAPRACAPEV